MRRRLNVVKLFKEYFLCEEYVLFWNDVSGVGERVR